MIMMVLWYMNWHVDDVLVRIQAELTGSQQTTASSPPNGKQTHPSACKVYMKLCIHFPVW